MKKTIGLTLVIVFVAVFTATLGIIFAASGSKFFIFLLLGFLPMMGFFIAIALIMTKGIKNNHIEATTIRCPFCHQSTKQSGQFCAHCGNELHTHSVCEYCGTLNDEGSIQCKNCNGLL
jgi:ribosomal protein L32